MKVLLFLLTVLFSTSSYSVTVNGNLVHPITVSWDIPTQWDNGDTLQLTSISKYQINIQCNNRPPHTLSVASASTTSHVIPKSFVGNCNFRVATVDTSGIPSEWSDVKTVLIKLNKPLKGGFR